MIGAGFSNKPIRFGSLFCTETEVQQASKHEFAAFSFTQLHSLSSLSTKFLNLVLEITRRAQKETKRFK